MGEPNNKDNRHWSEEYKDFKWGDISQKQADAAKKKFLLQKPRFWVFGTLIIAVTSVCAYWAYKNIQSEKDHDKQPVENAQSVPEKTTPETPAVTISTPEEPVPPAQPLTGVWVKAQEAVNQQDIIYQGQKTYLNHTRLEYVHTGDTSLKSVINAYYLGISPTSVFRIEKEAEKELARDGTQRNLTILFYKKTGGKVSAPHVINDNKPIDFKKSVLVDPKGIVTGTDTLIFQ
jgi:hypothetical protein